MPIPANDDRRKNPRQSCRHDYLQVEDRDARLVDWSFGGLGIRFDDAVDMEPGEEIDIRLFDPVADGWETLRGVVRWVEADGKVGVEFRQTDQHAITILLRLLGSRLGEVQG